MNNQTTSNPQAVVERSEAPDMDAAQASRPEGMTQDSSRLWKVGVVFAVALGFVMAMLNSSLVISELLRPRAEIDIE